MKKSEIVTGSIAIAFVVVMALMILVPTSGADAVRDYSNCIDRQIAAGSTDTSAVAICEDKHP